MKRLVFLVTLLSLNSFANAVFYIHGHQDDWQIFMGASAYGDVTTSGVKVVFIYTTAGNSGPAYPAAYWQAREVAAKSSVELITQNSSWSCSKQAITGVVSHSIERCTNANTVSYFMRTSEGGNLLNLHNSGTAVSTVDSSTTYSSWADFYKTVKGIITLESNGQGGTTWLNGPDPDSSFNPNDHPDHVATAMAIVDASTSTSWGRVGYIDYGLLDVSPAPTPLARDSYIKKTGVFMRYDLTMQQQLTAAGYSSTIGNSFSISTYCESGTSSASSYANWIRYEVKRAY